MISQQMKIFLQVVDSGSFSKAAKVLFVTPASIMKHMNTLEQRLGIKLLKRSPQGIELTPAGQSLYQDGKRILEETQLAITKARQAELTNQIVIRVGSSLLNPSRVLSDLWIPFQTKHPQFKLSIVPYEDTKEQILSVISSLGEKIDILVGTYQSKKMLENACFLPLGTYRLCIAVPKHHRLSNRSILNYHDLNGEHLMMVKAGEMDLLDDLQMMLKKTYPQIQIVEAGYYYDINTFNDCEQNGILLLTLDGWASVHPSLKTIPLEEKTLIHYGILYAKKPSYQVMQFIETLKKECPQSE